MAFSISFGSSPHTWGTRRSVRKRCVVVRFIPAYVGNTGADRDRRGAPSVHPRIRGEHPVTCVHMDFEFGSSPHTWGTHPRARQIGQRRRFIPAYVRNTHGTSFDSVLVAVHPRIRGEHIKPFGQRTWCSGSSPHTWGTPGRPHQQFHLARFIPAYVGNTPGELPKPCKFPVHPRIRGEHALRQVDRIRALGSSPHTWGTQFPHFENTAVFRFIPAYVGNTLLVYY